MGHLGTGGEGDPCQMVLAGKSFDRLKIGQFRRSTAPRGVPPGCNNQLRSLRR